jgi:hypothetical protein
MSFTFFDFTLLARINESVGGRVGFFEFLPSGCFQGLNGKTSRLSGFSMGAIHWFSVSRI